MVTAATTPRLAIRVSTQHARRGHTGPVVVLLLFGIWLTRHFLFSDALPAGTDMLGFIARAQQNSRGLQAFGIWNPNSFGGIRQFTLESVLGLLTKLTGDPVTTVKLFALATVAGTGLSCYLLTWRWFGRRSAALTSGLLYVGSQQSLSHMASGHLNVSFAIALAPLVLYFWMQCVDSFTFRHAVALALALSGLVIARLDMVLYVLPFILLYPVVRACILGGWRSTWKNAVSTSGVVLAAGSIVNAYQVLPIIGGLRASWISPSVGFSQQAFLDRSLGFFPSLLGFGREIGYLAFTNQQTWFSHPFLSFQTYQVLAALGVVLALSALRWHRDVRTIFLVCSGLAAAFLAKGFRPPVAGPYAWVVQHVPFFASLRDPNRWLIIQALTFATLGGLTISHLLEKRLASKARDSRSWRRHVLPVSISALIAFTALPNITTLARGFLTVGRPAGQVALLYRVSADDGHFLVASVPFDQTRQFLSEQSYSGWEHDIGADSSVYSGHPAISDGDWNQWAADSIAYDATLLKSSDPAFGAVLGSVGVKYLVDFSNPATDPNLQPEIFGSFYQQRALDGMPTVLPAAVNAGGTLYRIRSASPWLSFRPNIAVIFGGRSGMSALAAQQEVDLSEWATITADDALAVGGIDQLLSLMEKSDRIVLSNERLKDIAILATPSIARLSGITSNVSQEDATQIVQSDASTRSGSLSNKLAPVPLVARSSTSEFRLATSLRDGQLWARVETGPTAARLTFSLDDRKIGHLTPLSPLSGAFRWLKLPTPVLSPGTHVLSVSASPSAFGDAFEIDEAKIVHARERFAAMNSISDAVEKHSDQLLMSIDLDNGQKWENVPRVPTSSVHPGESAFWTPLDDTNVQASLSPDNPDETRITTEGYRTFYTLVAHDFESPRDWSDRQYFTLRFNGDNSGLSYRLVLDSTSGSPITYVFTDDQQGWTRETFSTQSPTIDGAAFDWSKVRALRLALDSKAARTSVAIGPLALSRRTQTVNLSFPMPLGPHSVSFVSRNGLPLAGRSEEVRSALSNTGLDVSVPFGLLGKGARLIVTPTQPIAASPALPVTFTQEPDGGYGFSFASQESGVLVLAQGFDPNWRLSEGDDSFSVSPIPTQSLLNGFVMSSGSHRGALEIRGHDWVWLGWLVSFLGLACSIAVIRRRPQRFLRERSRRESEPLGIRWLVALVAIAFATIIAVSIVKLPVNATTARPSYRWPTVVNTEGWSALSPAVGLHRKNESGIPATAVRVSEGRSTHSILEARLTPSQDWVGRRHLYVYFKGQGSGMEYHLKVQSDSDNYASFEFLDSGSGWRIITIDLESPDSVTGAISLSHVSEIRVASSHRKQAQAFAVGPMLLSQGGVTT
jgi:hypothetical protein